MLQALSGWLLDKAQQQRPQAEALMSARLAPDMYPLSSQIRFAWLQAQEAAYRPRGEPLPEVLDRLAQEGQNAGEQQGSLSDAQARICENSSAALRASTGCARCRPADGCVAENNEQTVKSAVALMY